MNTKPQVEVIISLYNYQDYIIECVESVLRQSYKNVIISIIDDGSTDKSVEVLKNTFSFSSRLKLIMQDNKGQLGAFNTGFENLDDKSEIVLFLDADDYMQKDYIAHIVDLFVSKECDYIFSAPKVLHNGSITSLKTYPPFSYGDLHFGIFKTYYLLTYYGTSTSGIAILKRTLAKILPLRELESKWRIRADDCIIFGAALVGAKIFYTSFEGIIYRVHSSNNYCGKRFDASYEFSRTLAIQELFYKILKKNSIFLTYRIFMQEFYLAQKPRKLSYLKILILCPFPLSQKIWAFFKIIAHIK